MPIARKPQPTFEGEGELRITGFTGPVAYLITGVRRQLRPGHIRFRGSIRATPQVAEEAFRAGEGVLVLDDGAPMRITTMAHTAGGCEVFVEVRA